MTRVPYATLVATIMCCLGVGVFCSSMYRGASLGALMLDQVFHIRLSWLEAVQTVFAIIGASMAALGFMILCVGCLATGATRIKVYRAWRTRVGGRISCAFVSMSFFLQTKRFKELIKLQWDEIKRFTFAVHDSHLHTANFVAARVRVLDRCHFHLHRFLRPVQ